jgi:hypothetical protein
MTCNPISSVQQNTLPVDLLQTAHHVAATLQNKASMETPPYLKVQTLAPDVLEGATITCIEAWGEYERERKNVSISAMGSHTSVRRRRFFQTPKSNDTNTFMFAVPSTCLSIVQSDC